MKNNEKNRVRLLDIAQASGVSLTAASLALSDKPGVSQATRDRVYDVARSLGYRMKNPQAAARLRSFTTIALLVKYSPGDDPHENQFYGPLISAVESTARHMNINLLFSHIPVSAENFPLEPSSLVIKSDLDGVILMGVLVDEPLLHALEDYQCPVVLIDSYSPHKPFSSVLSDNEPGAFQAVEYLIQKGHRHIGFIGGQEGSYPSLRDRRLGYQRALAGHHIAPEYVIDCPLNRAQVSTAVVQLIKKNPQITALMAVNDKTAITAMFALREAGYRVPQDVSIIGFDDIDLAETVMPPLTTMSISKQNMGSMAVYLLINHAFQTQGCTVTSLFRPVLVERSSVAAVSVHK